MAELGAVCGIDFKSRMNYLSTRHCLSLTVYPSAQYITWHLINEVSKESDIKFGSVWTLIELEVLFTLRTMLLPPGPAPYMSGFRGGLF